MTRIEVMVDFKIPATGKCNNFGGHVGSHLEILSFGTFYIFPNIINGFLALENICFDTTFMVLQ